MKPEQVSRCRPRSAALPAAAPIVGLAVPAAGIADLADMLPLCAGEVPVAAEQGVLHAVEGLAAAGWGLGVRAHEKPGQEPEKHGKPSSEVGDRNERERAPRVNATVRSTA